jgi:hypothetical protein
MAVEMGMDGSEEEVTQGENPRLDLHLRVNLLFPERIRRIALARQFANVEWRRECYEKKIHRMRQRAEMDPDEWRRKGLERGERRSRGWERIPVEEED